MDKGRIREIGPEDKKAVWSIYGVCYPKTYADRLCFRKAARWRGLTDVEDYEQIEKNCLEKYLEISDKKNEKNAGRSW